MTNTTVKHSGVTFRTSETDDERGKAIPAQIYQYPTRHRPQAAPRRPLRVSKRQPCDKCTTGTLRACSGAPARMRMMALELPPIGDQTVPQLTYHALLAGLQALLAEDHAGALRILRARRSGDAALACSREGAAVGHIIARIEGPGPFRLNRPNSVSSP